MQGVYSHDTALSYYELSDINPSKLHMTVPKAFRRSADVPKILILYRMDLSKTDIAEGPGYRVTTPIRTVRDIIEGRQISLELVEQAVRPAVDRGLITRSQFKGLHSWIGTHIQDPFVKEVGMLLKRIA